MDGSVFMGVTGLGKKWLGHEEYLFQTDGLVNFWRCKRPGSEKYALYRNTGPLQIQ